MVMLEEPFPPIVETLRRAAAALRGSEVPFALGGGLACWARGGPESTNDLDLMVRPADAEAALGALERAGMRTERPPEEWLYKAWDGDVLVDVIFRMVDGTVDDELLERSDALNVASVRMRVMRVEDVLASKLFALHEHHLDYEPLLRIARALREQIDWAEVLRRTRSSPFARAYFTLLQGLDIVELPPAAGGEVAVRAEEPELQGAAAFGPAADEPH